MYTLTEESLLLHISDHSEVSLQQQIIGKSAAGFYLATWPLRRLCTQYSKFTLGPLDLTLESGIVLGLIGANGAGKTTLFRSLMGTVRPNQGAISVCGVEANQNNSNWKQVLGYVGDTQVFFEGWRAQKKTRRLLLVFIPTGRKRLP